MGKAQILAAAVALLALRAHSARESEIALWRVLAPGVELRLIQATSQTRQSGAAADQPRAEAKITVLRIDPKLWELEFQGISLTGEASPGHTARDWCKDHHYVAAINAGMYDTDNRTHVGYLGAGDHVNNKQINHYQSVAAFAPRDGSLPPFRIFDLDAEGVTFKNILKDYGTAIQNLRLIRRPGISPWGRQTRRWSEAALGEDQAGRILFIFSRSPFSMDDFNRRLLAADIGLVAAQHLEGGPEAQLYYHLGQTETELFGSYETAFRENDSTRAPWPVPNILGVRARAQK